MVSIYVVSSLRFTVCIETLFRALGVWHKSIDLLALVKLVVCSADNLESILSHPRDEVANKPLVFGAGSSFHSMDLLNSVIRTLMGKIAL
jgi:branched-subunit amino acid permease